MHLTSTTWGNTDAAAKRSAYPRHAEERMSPDRPAPPRMVAATTREDDPPY